MDWFNLEKASSAFLAQCSQMVILISIEVSKPETRELSAYFQVHGHLPRQFYVTSRGARLEEVAAALGKMAEHKSRMLTDAYK